MSHRADARAPGHGRPGPRPPAPRVTPVTVVGRSWCAIWSWWSPTVLFLIPFYLIVRNALASDLEITAATGRSSHAPSSGATSPSCSPTRPSTSCVAWRTPRSSPFCRPPASCCCRSMAGYGLARIPYRHATKIFYAILVTLMIPPAVTFIPSFIIVVQLGWVGHPAGHHRPGAVQRVHDFLFRQYFLSFPKELEEAARVDGLGYFGAYWRIVVPNSLAFFAAIAVITFIASWNAFLWPLVIGQDQSNVDRAGGAVDVPHRPDDQPHELFLAAAVSIAPLVLVFVFLQRYLVQGVAETGIKG